MTRAGGIDMPGEIAGTVAIDEVVVHGWDVAVATGGDYFCDEELLQAAYGFAQAAVARDPGRYPGPVRPAGTGGGWRAAAAPAARTDRTRSGLAAGQDR